MPAMRRHPRTSPVPANSPSSVVSDRRLELFRRRATLVHDRVEGTTPVLVRVVHHDVDEDGHEKGEDRGAVAHLSSAALTALELLRYPHASGGIGHVATVLSDLAEEIDPDQLAALAMLVKRPVVQRLGHLLEHVVRDAVTGPMLDALLARGLPPWTELDRQDARGPGLRARTAGTQSAMARHRAPRAGARRMIPAQNLVAWGNVVPWTDLRQVELDLIISRALIVVFLGRDRPVADLSAVTGSLSAPVGSRLHALHQLHRAPVSRSDSQRGTNGHGLASQSVSP